jgi:hypothetical protein
VGDSLIWVHGVHNMTFGADYRRQQINRASDPNARGQFTFTGLATANLVNGVASTGTGFDFADFLLGTPDTSALRYSNNGSLYFRTHAYDVYATDDWRISQKFSINFGLRWDYASPITELNNQLVNLNIAPGFAAIVPVLPGQAGLPFSHQAGPNNISPRIGFAWRSIPKKSMVIRAVWDATTVRYNTIASNMAQQPPFAQTLSIASSPLNPLTLQNGFVVPANNPITNTYAIDPNYRIGYAQMWQIAIQNDLGHSLVGTITYNGTKGTGLDQTILPNSAPRLGPTVPSLPVRAGERRPIYHGASAQPMRRFRNGRVNAIYTFPGPITQATTRTPSAYSPTPTARTRT